MDLKGLDEEELCTQMAAWGRQFKVGDFYDYKTDKIADGQVFWESSDLASAIKTKEEFLKVLEVMTSNKWRNMNIEFNEHLHMSFMGGLIDNYSGASHYLNHISKKTDVTRTLVCRVRSEEKKINDLESLVKRVISERFGGNGENFESLIPDDSTHVVVGVIYGAEAYCILSIKEEMNKDNPKVTEEYLHGILSKMQLALKEEKTVTEFASDLDGDEIQMTVRLYADFQEENVQVCNILKAYEQCQATIERAKKEPIPIAVLLHPLRNIEALLVADRCSTPRYEYYSEVNLKRSLEILKLHEAVEQVIVKADDIYATALQVGQIAISDSVNQFRSVVSKYLEIVKKALQRAVLNKRKDDDDANETDDSDSSDFDVEDVSQIFEKDLFFKSIKLDRWLSFKKTEMEIVKKMEEVNGAVILKSRESLEEELGKKTYSVVVTVPPLDDLTKNILEGMNKCVDMLVKVVDGDKNQSETTGSDDDSELEEIDGLRWNKFEFKQKQVMAKINQLTHYAKQKENQVQFIFILDKDAPEVFYSIFEKEKLVADKLERLAGPPIFLRFLYQTAAGNIENTPSFLVEWNQVEFVYPCQYVVEYRLKGRSDLPWEQRKTGETKMVVHGGSPMEVRVAVETCLGFSEFANILAATPAEEKAREKKERKVAELVEVRNRRLLFEPLLRRMMEFCEEAESLQARGFHMEC